MSHRSRTLRAALGWCLAAFASVTAAADPLPVNRGPPFTQTRSNVVPLAFGMTSDDAAAALGSPLHYVRGRPGEETLLAIRTIGGGGLFPRNDRLFLQFRRGRLTGFKGDWGNNWMWR